MYAVELPPVVVVFVHCLQAYLLFISADDLIYIASSSDPLSLFIM